MHTLPLIANSPLVVLEAIEKYCHGEGGLFDIAQALDIPAGDFSEVIDWYMTNWNKPFSGEKPNPQTLLSIILLQLLKSDRQELIRQKKTLSDFEKKLRRLNAPYRS